MSIFKKQAIHLSCPLCNAPLQIIEATEGNPGEEVNWYDISLESMSCSCFCHLTLGLPEGITLEDIKSHPQWYKNIKRPQPKSPYHHQQKEASIK